MSQELNQHANTTSAVARQSSPDHGRACALHDRDDAIMAALARIEALLSRLIIQPANQPTITAASSTDREWLTATEVAQLFGISVNALYSDVERGGRFADAASRVGKRLRFSRRGLDRLPLRNSGRRSHLRERVPSPGGSERW